MVARRRGARPAILAFVEGLLLNSWQSVAVGKAVPKAGLREGQLAIVAFE